MSQLTTTSHQAPQPAGALTADDAPVVQVEQRGAVLWIAIDREARRNAINPMVIAGIEDALRSVEQRTGVRAVVLTAQGDKAFCAGADLTRGTNVFSDGMDEPTTDFGRLARVVRRIGVPIIGRINGDCVAGGMALLSLCDLAIAADHARFGLPEAKVGVFPMQVLVYLRRTLAPRHVNELCLTGQLITAARAADIGLVNHIVSSAQLDAAVQQTIDQVLQMSPVALKRGKAAIATMENMGFEEALGYAEAQITIASQTSAAREGLAAFNDKRRPAWAQAQ